MDDFYYYSYYILFFFDNYVLYVYLSYNIYSIFYSYLRIFCEFELVLYERFCNDLVNDLFCEWDIYFWNLYLFFLFVLVV